MSVDLPGIRARAEFDLNLFRQQEEQIKASLRAVANEMRTVPAARIRFDTSDASKEARAAAAEARRAVREIQNSQNQLVDAQGRSLTRRVDAERTAANTIVGVTRRRVREELTEEQRLGIERAKELNRAVRLTEQFNNRQRAANRARLAEEARLSREVRGEERRVARAELPIAAGLGATGVLITQQLLEATRVAADFEKAMSQVRAVMSPAEWRAIGQEITTLARNLGTTGLGFTATEAATALEAMTKAGISAKDQLAGAPAVLALAAAGNVQLADAANLAASAIATFGKTGQDLTAIANLLTGVANATIADIDNLRLSLAQAGAAGALTGQELDQVILALGLLAQAGIRSSDAGTSLRVMMLRLIPQSEAAARAMQQFGIIVNGNNRFVNETTGSFKDLNEVAQILQETLGTLTEAEQQFALRTIFGQDAVRSATVLLRAGARGFAELNAEASKTTAIDVARTRLDNLRGDLTNLNAVWQNTQITLGRALEPNIRPLVQSITELLNSLKGVSPEVARTAAALLGAVGVTATLTGATLSAAAAFKLFGITAAQVGAGILAISPPVGALLAVTAALAVAWVNNWGDIQTKTVEASRAIQQTTKEISDSIQGLATVVNNTKIDFRILTAFENVIGGIGQLGEQAGIKWGEQFGKAASQLLRNFLSAQAGGVLGNPVISQTIEALQKLGLAQQRATEQAQRRAFEESLTPEVKAADQERIAKTLIGNLPEIVKESLVRGFQDGFEAAAAAVSQSDVEQRIIELGEKFGEAFTSLDPSAQFSAAHRQLTTELAGSAEQIFERLGQTVKDTFRELGIFVTDDVLDDIINVLTADAAGRISAAAESNAAAFVGPWKKAYAALQQTNNDFDEALRRVGTDTEAIAVLVKLNDAAVAADKGFKDLADRGLAAALIAKRNDALQTKDLEEKTRLLIEVGEEYIAHKEAEARTLEEVTKWQKLQADIAEIGPKLMEDRARNLAESVFPALTAAQQIQIRTMQAEGQAAEAAAFALRAVGVSADVIGTALAGTGAQAERTNQQLRNLAQIPFVGLDQYKERLESIANSAMPGLTAAEQRHVQILQLQNEHLRAAQFAVTALGGDFSKLGDIEIATGAKMARVNAEIAELARVRDVAGNAFDITKDKAQQFFNQIIQDAPAAQRAQLEMVAGTEGVLEGLRQRYIQLGLDISRLPDFATASARKIQEAMRQVEARQFFQETGELLPASEIQTAGKAFREAARSAEKDIAESREQIRKELEDARKEWRDAVKDAAKELAAARTEFAQSIGKIDKELQQAEADIDAAIKSAIASYIAGLAAIEAQEAKLRSDFARSADERSRQFREQAAEAARQLARQLRETSRQIAQTVFEATQRQREQLQQLAQQLADLRSREFDEARSISVQLEDIALRALTAQTEEERQEIARERIRLQAEAGAQAVQLQREISRGQFDLRDQAEKANEALIKAVDDLRRQSVQAINDFNISQRKAFDDFIRAQRDAERQFREQLVALEKQREELAAQLRAQLEELRKRREEARKAAKEAKEAAQKQLDEAERVNQEQLKKAQDQLDLAERLSIEELRAAQDKFNEQMAVAQEALRAAQHQAGLTDQLYNESRKHTSQLDDLITKWRPIQIDMTNSNVEEGDVEFLERAAELAEARAMAPIG